MRFKHCYLCFNSESPGQGLVVKILYLQQQCGTGSSCNNRNNLYTKKKDNYIRKVHVLSTGSC